MTPSAAARSASRSTGRGAFIRQFIMNTGMVGAIAPSSKQLGEAMVQGLDFANARAILEFGPGSGMLTDAILKRLHPHTKFLPIELNDDMAIAFKKRHPNIPLIRDSAANARQICNQHGIDKVDLIVSGLPWASFPESLQVSILDAARDVLKPGGTMVTFGYHVGTLLPAGKRFYRLLPKYFDTIQKSSIVWRNIPPAFFFRCTTKKN